MKNVESRAAALGITFIALMLLVAGLRVDTSVFVFAFGFVCGVLSSVPLTIVLTMLVLRYREQGEIRERRRRRREMSPQPPVVIVQQPPGVAHMPQPVSWQDQDELPFAPTRRGFTMIGDGEGT
jgi:hypothetical protein